jgi:hypothetical protein
MPSQALEHQHLDVVGKPDGKFSLVCTQEYRMVQAELKENADGTYNAVKVLMMTMSKGET